MEEQTDDDSPPPSSPRLLQTEIRETLSPYLPPPVLKAIDRIDPQLEPYVGPEASISIIASLLLAWMVVSLIRFLSRRQTGRAIADEDDDHVLSNVKTMVQEEFSHTVLLCGPRGAGKTRLFYQLCFHDSNIPTVQSIKANLGIVNGIRYMDWPGHAPLNDAVLLPILKAQPRIVLVLDATQPVASAADSLYQLLEFAKQQQQQPIRVFIACHKTDLPKAKNWRRVKIQMRTELERLLKAKSTDNHLWWPAGEPLELDDLPFAQLHFGSTTCQGNDGSAELVAFCQTGEFPNEDSR